MNIDTFRVKKLENLVIPVKSLYKHPSKHHHPVKKLGNDITMICFEWGDNIYLEGSVLDEKLTVTAIDCCSEFSGTIMSTVFEPALADSTGTLIASCVWEGGDSINQLRVEDGKVEWIDIEI